MKRPLMRYKKGFTLIELMIVVAIIGILLAIFIPNFLAYREKAKEEAKEINRGVSLTADVTYGLPPGGVELSVSDLKKYRGVIILIQANLSQGKFYSLVEYEGEYAICQISADAYSRLNRRLNGVDSELYLKDITVE